MRVCSLFCGIGGFDLAFVRHGHQIVYANDWDKYAAQIYEKNFGPAREKEQKTEFAGGSAGSSSPNARQCSHSCGVDRRSIRDVLGTVIPEFDLLSAGFPCQSFSIVGNRQGFKDTRGALFFEIARILKDKQPPLLLLENTKGLLSNDEGKTFETILRTLDELGYDLQWQVLNSKDWGVPQNRERVFIVGHLRGTSRSQVFPLQRDDGKTSASIATCALCATYNKRDRGVFFIGEKAQFRMLTPLECERLQGFPDGWTEGLSDTRRYGLLGNAVTVNVVEEIIKKLGE